MSALDILKRLYAESDGITGRSPADLRLSHVLDDAALAEIDALARHDPLTPADAIEHLDVAAYCMAPSPAVALIDVVSEACAASSVTGPILGTLREAIRICDASDHPHIVALLETVLEALKRPRVID